MMTKTADIREREQEIVEEFSLFDDWMGRYEYLIEMGNDVPQIEADYKTDAYRVRGCQSQVWVRAEEDDGLVFFKGDSDASITRGLVALLIRVLDGQPAEAIVESDLGFLDAIGMKDHLSPNRKNGLNAMVKQMKARAESFQN